jgi:hypothetical protein
LIDDKPIGAPLNRNLGSPVPPGEAVEAELDRLITPRHDARVSFARTLGVESRISHFDHLKRKAWEK